MTAGACAYAHTVCVPVWVRVHCVCVWVVMCVYSMSLPEALNLRSVCWINQGQKKKMQFLQTLPMDTTSHVETHAWAKISKMETNREKHKRCTCIQIHKRPAFVYFCVTTVCKHVTVLLVVKVFFASFLNPLKINPHELKRNRLISNNFYLLWSLKFSGVLCWVTTETNIVWCKQSVSIYNASYGKEIVLQLAIFQVVTI